MVSWVVCFGWFKLVGESVLDVGCCLLVFVGVGVGVGDGLVGRGITRALGKKNSQYLL